MNEKKKKKKEPGKHGKSFLEASADGGTKVFHYLLRGREQGEKKSHETVRKKLPLQKGPLRWDDITLGGKKRGWRTDQIQPLESRPRNGGEGNR